MLAFWAALGATFAAAAFALWSGLRRRRRLHLVLGPATLLLLAVAVLCTEALLRRYAFPADALRFHLRFAVVGGWLALPVAVTGLLLLRWPAWRRWHRWCVFAFLAGVLLATATGVWLFAQATPR